jgi:vancomycin resistance protein YoaR
MQEQIVSTPLARARRAPLRRSRARLRGEARRARRIAQLGLAAQPTLIRPGRAGIARGVVAFVVTIATVSAVSLSYLSNFATTYAGRALPNVQLAGVPITGLDRAQAEASVRQALPLLDSGSLIVRVGREQFTVAYADFGRDYDMAAMLDAAFAPGHTGSALDQSLEGLRSLRRPTEIAPTVRFGAEELERRVLSAARGLAVRTASATVALADDASGFVVTPAVVGRSVDPAPALRRALAVAPTLHAGDVVVRLKPHPIAPAYTTAEAESAAGEARRLTDVGLALVGQKLAFQLRAEKIRTWIRIMPTREGDFAVSIDSAAARKTVEALAPKVYRAPVDAELLSAGTTVVGYRRSQTGRALDTEATLSNVLAALETAPPARGPRPVDLVFRSLVPDFTDAEARTMVGPLVRLSAWTVPYVPSERNFYGANIKIPTATIDGYVLEPGESFAFWNAIGEVSRARGYGDGGVIRDGRTYPTGALAGGICSCSTTLFNAAVRAGLQILERHNHYYYIDRYPVGLDATVLKSSGGAVQDMRFRNDTPSPILIRGVNQYGKVTFEIYGVPDGRRVEWSSPIVKNRVAAGDYVQYTSTLPTGVRKRVEYPVAGFDSWVTRTVRAKDGRVIHQETFYSHYARINGLILIGR